MALSSAVVVLALSATVRVCCNICWLERINSLKIGWILFGSGMCGKCVEGIAWKSGWISGATCLGPLCLRILLWKAVSCNWSVCRPTSLDWLSPAGMKERPRFSMLVCCFVRVVFDRLMTPSFWMKRSGACGAAGFSILTGCPGVLWSSEKNEGTFRASLAPKMVASGLGLVCAGCSGVVAGSHVGGAEGVC